MKRSSHVRLPSPPIKQLASFTRFTRSRRRLADLFYVGTTDRNMSSSQWTTVFTSSHLSLAVSHSLCPSRAVTDCQEHFPEILTAQHADRPEDSSRQLHQCAALSLCLPHRLLHRLSPSSCSIPPFQRRHARDSFQLRKIHETLGNTSIRTLGPPICRSS